MAIATVGDAIDSQVTTADPILLRRSSTWCQRSSIWGTAHALCSVAGVHQEGRVTARGLPLSNEYSFILWKDLDLVERI